MTSRLKHKTDGHHIKSVRCPRCQSQGRDTKGNNLAVYSDGHGFCYAGHGYFPQRELEDILRKIDPTLYRNNSESIGQRLQNLERNAISEPHVRDARSEISRLLRFEMDLWLLSVNLTKDLVEKYEIQLDMHLGAVVFPLKYNNAITVRSARCFREGMPKWKTYGRRSDLRDIFRPSDMDSLDNETRMGAAQPQDIVIFVEDVPSAIRCASAGFNSYPLLGTSVTDDVLCTLSNMFSNVIVWLDSDAYGKSLNIYLRA